MLTGVRVSIDGVVKVLSRLLYHLIALQNRALDITNANEA